MKVAVYTICKDELKHLHRWLQSCKGADLIHVTDTGSKDGTLEELKKLQKDYPNLTFNSVTVFPWRFDDARNFSLYSLPEDVDVCVCLDMDEILVAGWRDMLDKAFLSGEEIDRLRYNYVWSWATEGVPAVTYHADKVHMRHGFRWVNPVHEVLVRDARLGVEHQTFVSDTLIMHYPDSSKSRGNYLPLLELAVRENPMNDRNSHYLARELMYAGRYQEALAEFERHLQLPTARWKSERSASMRYQGDCYWALGDQSAAIDAFLDAIEESPGEREPYVALAQAMRARGDWVSCRDFCEKALSITDRPNTYINQPSSWNGWVEQMLAEARSHVKAA